MDHLMREAALANETPIIPIIHEHGVFRCKRQSDVSVTVGGRYRARQSVTEQTMTYLGLTEAYYVEGPSDLDGINSNFLLKDGGINIPAIRVAFKDTSGKTAAQSSHISNKMEHWAWKDNHVALLVNMHRYIALAAFSEANNFSLAGHLGDIFSDSGDIVRLDAMWSKEYPEGGAFAWPFSKSSADAPSFEMAMDYEKMDSSPFIDLRYLTNREQRFVLWCTAKWVRSSRYRLDFSSDKLATKVQYRNGEGAEVPYLNLLYEKAVTEEEKGVYVTLTSDEAWRAMSKYVARNGLGLQESVARSVIWRMYCQYLPVTVDQCAWALTKWTATLPKFNSIRGRMPNINPGTNGLLACNYNSFNFTGIAVCQALFYGLGLRSYKESAERDRKDLYMPEDHFISASGYSTAAIAETLSAFTPYIGMSGVEVKPAYGPYLGDVKPCIWIITNPSGRREENPRAITAREPRGDGLKEEPELVQEDLRTQSAAQAAMNLWELEHDIRHISEFKDMPDHGYPAILQIETVRQMVVNADLRKMMTDSGEFVVGAGARPEVTNILTFYKLHGRAPTAEESQVEEVGEIEETAETRAWKASGPLSKDEIIFGMTPESQVPADMKAAWEEMQKKIVYEGKVAAINQLKAAKNAAKSLIERESDANEPFDTDPEFVNPKPTLTAEETAQKCTFKVVEIEKWPIPGLPIYIRSPRMTEDVDMFPDEYTITMNTKSVTFDHIKMSCTEMWVFSNLMYSSGFLCGLDTRGAHDVRSYMAREGNSDMGIPPNQRLERRGMPVIVNSIQKADPKHMFGIHLPNEAEKGTKYTFKFDRTVLFIETPSRSLTKRVAYKTPTPVRNSAWKSDMYFYTAGLQSVSGIYRGHSYSAIGVFVQQTRKELIKMLKEKSAADAATSGYTPQRPVGGEFA